MRRTPLFVALISVLVAPALHAQALDQKPDAKTLDTLIVTGTRVANRTVAESTSPIDVLTAESLRSTGTTELATALGRLLPSLNFPRLAISDGSDAVRPAQLRGL
ncbi:MAG: TonB-dependent receptor, partial [Thermomonas sp.]